MRQRDNMKIYSLKRLIIWAATIGLVHSHARPKPAPLPYPYAMPIPQATGTASASASAAATTTAANADSIPGWPDVPPDLVMAYAFIKNQLSMLPPAEMKGSVPIITTWNNANPLFRAALLQKLFNQFWQSMSQQLRLQVIFVYITPMTNEEMGADLKFPRLYSRMSDRNLPFFLDSVDSFVAGGGMAELWNTPHDLMTAIETGNVNGLLLDIRALCDVMTDGMFEMLNMLPSWLTDWVTKTVKEGLEWLFGGEKPASDHPPPPAYPVGPNAALVG